MKKTILFTVLLIATVQFTFAQNTIAKLKFEEAGEAYENNNFELTLTKLNEVETLLKASNPKILYLRILAQSKIIEKNPLGDYAIIESAKTSINKYLKDYENLPDNEDKYREIYKISESSLTYLITRQEFDQQIKQIKQIEIEKKQIEIEKEARIEKEKEARKEAEMNRIKKYDDNFMNYIHFKYKVGLTIDETKKEYPELALEYVKNKTNSGEPEELISINKKFKFYVKNDKVVGYFGEISSGSKKVGISSETDIFYANVDKMVIDIKNSLEKVFNFYPSNIQTVGLLDKKGKKTSYSWVKKGKTIRLDIDYKERLAMFNSIDSYIISLYSIDENLVKPSQPNSGEIAKPSQQKTNELAKQLKSTFGLFK